MISKTVAVIVASGVLSAGAAFSQVAPNPTQQTVPVATGAAVPVFRITVVGRTTAAINYRPRTGETKVDFAGTALLPQARGTATVSGEKGYIKIDARFDKLEAPTRFGREYLTYVLWAITPEGRATNLGEIQVDDADARVRVTTELQSFGMIVTAEPYFAVTQPSDVVIIENIVRGDTRGGVEVIQAKHELLKRGAYLMNQDVARLNLKALEPGAPLDLAQARNAVELARVAGADRFAMDTYNKAAGLLATAEAARTARRGANAIMMPARQAAQTAEDARIVALQKQEEAFQEGERAAVLAREKTAIDIAAAEAARRRQAEQATQQAAAGQLAAERGRAADADAARLAADAARAASDAARVTAADAARLAAERAAAESEAARVAAAAQADGAAQRAAAQSEQEKTALRERLRTQLNVILDTRESARGLIVNLSDVLFDTGSATLKPGAREKLSRISGILASQQGLRMEVEGHTDDVGTDSSNQTLSERRGESVRTYLVGQGITSGTIGTKGLGEGTPVATNGTAAGRQQNRRVELIVSGDVIGTR
jgi:outer membrane protein OmpA-like peptidoglycan-associated protein